LGVNAPAHARCIGRARRLSPAAPGWKLTRRRLPCTYRQLSASTGRGAIPSSRAVVYFSYYIPPFSNMQHFLQTFFAILFRILDFIYEIFLRFSTIRQGLIETDGMRQTTTLDKGVGAGMI